MEKIVSVKASWKDPRSGEIYTNEEIVGKRFLANGMCVNDLIPCNEEKILARTVEADEEVKEEKEEKEEKRTRRQKIED